QKGRFDLVLSDVVLPDGNGVELVFQLLEQRPSLAGLLISGYTFSQSEWEYIRQKGLTLLQKPCKIVDLLKHVYQSIKGTDSSDVVHISVIDDTFDLSALEIYRDITDILPEILGSCNVACLFPSRSVSTRPS
ncbi:TPA: response regulator, partial [Candidatus Poribacteria bacterium]|nr:response regulator [Candidatus Poribacteria bacterium]